MKKSATKFYNWAIVKATSGKSPLWLALIFSLEMALFIPLDAIFMFFCLQKRSSIFLYILIATLASTFSGLLGYLFGRFLWDAIGSWVVPHLISFGSFETVSLQFQTYESLAVFFGSLLPFPLKVLSLAAGVFHIGVFPFLTFMILARLIRCSLIGACLLMWGEKVKRFIDQHFHRIFLLVGAKIAVALLFFWAIYK